MSDADRHKWDERYRAGDHAAGDRASAFLTEWETRLPRGRALDVACGTGRNSLCLAATGHAVDAIDISPVAIAKARAAANARGLTINWIEADLEHDADAVIPRGPYGLIVLVRYVNEHLLPLLRDRLAAGGVLLCEQHVDATAADVIGPRNPAFRLRPNALLEQTLQVRAPGDTVRYYREDVVTDAEKTRAALAQLILRRGAI